MSASDHRTYINALKSLCIRYPDLHKLNRYLAKREHFPGRAAVLQFASDGVERIDFQTVDGLTAYFSATVTSIYKHRLYLLEDLSTFLWRCSVRILDGPMAVRGAGEYDTLDGVGVGLRITEAVVVGAEGG